MLVPNRNCPVCNSAFVCELQHIYLQRQQTTSSQLFCMSCQSFFHISGYRESREQLAADARWLAEHPADFSGMITALRTLFPDATTCFEAGCGVGSLLSQLAEAGYSVRGVDPNAEAIELAQSHYGVAATCGYFSGGIEQVDLIFAIDVLEHLEEPRDFFSKLVSSVKSGGAVVVRVPYVENSRWHYLWRAGEDRVCDGADPFCDNSVHITHFSPQGLQKMGEELGGRLVARLGQYQDTFVFSVT